MGMLTCALRCIPKSSVLGFVYYMCLSGVRIEVRGSGSASSIFIAKDKEDKKEKGVRWTRAWCVAAITVFGPLLVSMMGILIANESKPLESKVTTP